MLCPLSLLGGEKVPILWNLSPNVARALHKFADVDIGHFGTSMAGIPVTTDTVDAEEIVWAAQYVNCINETRHEVCDPHLFNGTCWIHRYDYTPMKKQLSSLPHSKHPSSSAQWDDDGEDYPGNRQHQLKGRTIAFTVSSLPGAMPTNLSSSFVRLGNSLNVFSVASVSST